MPGGMVRWDISITDLTVNGSGTSFHFVAFFAYDENNGTFALAPFTSIILFPNHAIQA